MRFSNFKNFKGRKGIASVVGGLFFLVLMTSGFTAYYVALDSQSEMIDTQQLIASTEIKKIQEKFSISAAADPSNNNQLQILVKNQGYHPIEIADVWIINKTDTNQPVTKYELDYNDAFIPAGFGGQILENTPLYLNPDLYDIKVVSILGTIRTAELDVVSGINNLSAELYMISPDVKLGENATVVMYVTNTGSTLVTDVTPDNDPPPSDNPTWISNSQLVSPSSIDLEPSQSGIFVWQTELSTSGTVNSKLMFTDSVSGIESTTGNTVQSNVDSDKITLQEGGGGEIIVSDELFGRPQIFMIFPNAVGDDEFDRPLWGVLVANPTDQPMSVSKVVIMAISPRATSSDKIFVDNCHEKTDVTKPVAVAPTTDRWTCPESNQLMWRDLSDPVIVQPRSVHPFLVRIGADNFGSSTPDAINILIQPLVFTELGQFGKAGYGSTMHSKNVAMPNVFLSKVSSPGTAANSANMLGNITRITEGSTVVFNATLVDMGNDITYGINAGTKLIINLPKEWTFSHVASSVGFNMLPVQTFADGSTQIVGELTLDIDQQSQARIIKFYATAPAAATNAKMYVMYILADGIATGDSLSGLFTVGPIAETVLQVCPTTGCPS